MYAELQGGAQGGSYAEDQIKGGRGYRRNLCAKYHLLWPQTWPQ